MSGTLARARATVNFTGQRPVSDFSYKLVRAGEGGWGYKVEIPDLPDLALEYPNAHVVLAFRADCSYQRERFSLPVRQAVALKGPLEGRLQKVDDPGDIGIEISLTDASHQKLAFGERHAPDGVEEGADAAVPGRGKVRSAAAGASRLVQTDAPRGSLFHVAVDPRMGSMFDVVYRKGLKWMEMPTITVHPSFGKSAVLTPSPLRTSILVSSLRTMMHAIATRTECQEAGWYDAWEAFMGGLAPDEDGIGHFVAGCQDGAISSDELDRRINEAIARFVKDKGLVPTGDAAQQKEVLP